MKLLYRMLGGSILAALLFLTAGCNQVIQNPLPKVSSVSPASVTAGGATFNLTVKGSDFVFGGYILWNGSILKTLYINSGQVQTTISPQLFSQPGPITIQMYNPPPGGGNSNSVTFTINPGSSPIPTISSIQPTATQVGGTSFTLTVNGSNFTPTSVVTWNGNNLPATYVNNSQITASIPATDIQDPGTVHVAVLNSEPGGGLSNSVPFNVNNVTPIVTSLLPSTAIAGSTGFTLTVHGGGFACQDLTTTTTTTNGVTSTTTSCPQSASVIEWNGAQLSTTYDVTTGVLVANVSTAQLTQAGTAFVTVFNPTPGGGTSGNAYFQVIPGASGQGLPALIDVSSNGAQADSGIGNLGKSGPVIAGGGRFVAFSSVSQNLVSNLTNGVANVFLRDTCLGISSGCSPQTILVSQANNGVATNADALQPSISSNGRYVVFSSAATNLASGTGGSSEIYLRDTCLGAPSGCSPSTTLVSVASDGVSPADGSSTQPYISPDGQYVAFASTASDLVANQTTTAQEIYIRSTCLNATTACTPTTTLASVANGASTPAIGTSSSPVVSSGGRYVAFLSTANLTGLNTSATEQLYWRDTCIGASSCTPTTSLVSINSNSTSPGPGNGASGAPSMSADGRYVVFSSQATNLIGAGFASNTPQQIYERDMCAGASSCTPSTTLVSVAADGSSPANAQGENPQTDQTGRYVLFDSAASNLISTKTNGFEQIYARDTCVGATSCTPRTVLISLAADGTTLGNGNSLYPTIASQAHFAAFLSFSSNIVNDDTTPNLEDIFLASTTF